MAAQELPTMAFGSRAGWAEWLDRQHSDSPGLWLQLAKKDSGIASVNYAEALEVALCYGWIDGQKAPMDDAYWLQRFGPRRPRSRWSKRNVDIATRLIESGEMTPAGLREVEQAQADGRWEAAYEGQRAATVPDDLRSALDANPVARDFFETLNGTNRYAILYRVQDAKKPETRARRIEKYVAMLAEHRTIYP